MFRMWVVYIRVSVWVHNPGCAPRLSTCVFFVFLLQAALRSATEHAVLMFVLFLVQTSTGGKEEGSVWTGLTAVPVPF